jgi:hypothetical protein
VAAGDADQADEARRGEARPASAPSSLRLSSPAPTAAPPAAHPRRRSGGSSARGCSPRNTSGRRRSACPGTGHRAQLRQGALPPPTRPTRRLRRCQARLHLLRPHRRADEGERSGLPTEEGGAVGRRQRRGVRRAQCASGRGEECGGRDMLREEKGHGLQGAWMGGGALMRREMSFSHFQLGD